ncbi:MAG: long-chain-fatty-acid--CoA ligase [Xanthobacteraceae bacterium]
MERIWLKHYPKGVPHEIDPSRYASVAALFEESFAKFRGDDAYVFMDKRLTFGDVDELSRAFGAWLQSRGLKRGARVALMMPNVLQYPIALAAVLRAGYVVVNVNPLYTPHELNHQLQDSGAEAIVILENFAHTLVQVIGDTQVKHVVVASIGEMLGFPKSAIVNFVVRYVKKMVPAFSLPGSVKFSAALAAGRRMQLSAPKIAPDNIAFLQYTGGTTGISKGATLLHRNIVANVLQNDAWLQPAIERPPHVERLFIVTAMPLYHVFALTGCCLLGMRSGGICLLIANPRDIPGLVKELAKYKISFFPAVNTLYNALMHHRDFGKIDFSMLKASVGGGMAVQRAVAERWFELTGSPIIEGYGLSETSPVLTCNSPDSTEYSGTIGLPLPSTEISIRDDLGGELRLGEPGEICARGPQVMAGYWRRPDETANVTTADGFFRTGDIGIMDATGRVKIVDRKKDMIIVSGFKVYPNEVEDVVAHHPGVLESAVIGVPNGDSGEAVKLFVVKRDPNLTEQELRKFLAAELTNYKRPKFIEFRNELPKTNIGKILRRALRDEEFAKKKAAA